MGKAIASAITKGMASWRFIIYFLSFCALWMLSNGLGWIHVDIMPFIFLNLMLSLMAAVQAPVIMISQRIDDEKRDLMLQSILESNAKNDELLEAIISLEQRIINDVENKAAE